MITKLKGFHLVSREPQKKDAKSQRTHSEMCKVGLYGRCRRAVNCQIDRCPSPQETGQLYIPKVGRWPDDGCPRSDLKRGSDFACRIKGIPILLI